MDIPLKCRCGALTGVVTDVSRDTAHRAVCYCDDCQCAAEFFGEGSGVDAQGGSDVLQVSQAQVKITGGAEHLRCMRLSPKGLMRWYAGCCDTPLANVLARRRVPFVGVHLVAMDLAATGRSADHAMGRPRIFVQGRYARGGCPPHAEPKVKLTTLGPITGLMLRWAIRGMHSPSPFFTDAGAPVTTPKVLSRDERNALRDKVSQHASG